MAKKHFLKTDFEHDYFLVGIKSVLEDYRLAYYLNCTFDLQLKKEDFSLNFSSKDGEFPIFGFEDSLTNKYWSLIVNKQIIEEKVPEDVFSLFEEIANTYILIPEEKTVDYFIKIESNISKKDKENVLKKISTIHRVIASYEINPNNLKSKDILIF